MDSGPSSRESLTHRKGQRVSSFIRIMHGGNLLPESRNIFFLLSVGGGVCGISAASGMICIGEIA